MKLIHVCIVISACISPISARFRTPQSTFNDEDFEIKILSDPFDSDKYVVSDHVLSSSSQFSDNTQGNATIIDFDDIELATPFAPITKYSPFTLGGFTLMNVALAYKNGSLEPEDINCASSAPNALMGSRADRSVWPRIALSSGFQGASSKAKSFRLLGLSMKPLGATPVFLSFIVQGWVIESGRAVDYAAVSVMYLREGHQPVFNLDVTRWVTWQKNVSVIEMWAQTREGEDWEFCVDDVRIELVEE